MKINNESLKRNTFKSQFFNGVNLAGSFEFPKIYKQSIKIDCDFLPFNIFRSYKNKSSVGVHFFIDDYHFECLWQNIEKYICMLRSAKLVIGPDFSLYQDMPKALQIFNTYRNRAITTYLQSRGIKIIPVVSWSDEDSFTWSFDGIEKGSVVAISSNGVRHGEKAKKLFLKGFEKMKERLKPNQILFVGRVPKELETEPLIKIKSYSEILKEKLGG